MEWYNKEGYGVLILVQTPLRYDISRYVLKQSPLYYTNRILVSRKFLDLLGVNVKRPLYEEYMEVIKISPRGYCYGVVDALQTVRQVAKDPTNPRPIYVICLLYTSPSPRDRQKSRMPSSA